MTIGVSIIILLAFFAAFFFIFVKVSKSSSSDTEKKSGVSKLSVPALRFYGNEPDQDELLTMFANRQYSELSSLFLMKANDEFDKIEDDPSIETECMKRMLIYKYDEALSYLLDTKVNLDDTSDYDVELSPASKGICNKDGNRYDFDKFLSNMIDEDHLAELEYPCAGCRNMFNCGLSVRPK